MASRQAHLVLGFLTVYRLTPSAEIARARRVLADFAQREGYRLGEVFVDEEGQLRGDALAALISHARLVCPVAVLVPRIEDLGLRPWLAEATRARLQRDAGVSVLVAVSDVTQ